MLNARAKSFNSSYYDKEAPIVRSDNPDDVGIRIPSLPSLASIDTTNFKFGDEDEEDEIITDLSSSLLLSSDCGGYPRGLAKVLYNSVRAFPLRIWLLDNSDSMKKSDGHYMIKISDEEEMTNEKIVSSSINMNKKKKKSTNRRRSTATTNIRRKSVVTQGGRQRSDGSTNSRRSCNSSMNRGKNSYKHYYASSFYYKNAPDSVHLEQMDCTRWIELTKIVNYHSKMAAHLKAPSVFRFLNEPTRDKYNDDDDNLEIQQQFTISLEEGEEEKRGEELSNALRMLGDMKPGGVTPLTDHVRSIIQSMPKEFVETTLAGHKIAVVIITDGLPTDHDGNTSAEAGTEFTAAIKELMAVLPVWLVIRLCTDNDDVIDYYNELDDHLELNLEVINDYFNEGQEVYTYNPWFCYGMPLHHIREMGCYSRTFDLIDERPLSHEEMKEFCILLFDCEKQLRMCDPQLDWNYFLTKLETIMEERQQQHQLLSQRGSIREDDDDDYEKSVLLLPYNPVEYCNTPWIDIHKLHRLYRPKSNYDCFFCGDNGSSF